MAGGSEGIQVSFKIWTVFDINLRLIWDCAFQIEGWVDCAIFFHVLRYGAAKEERRRKGWLQDCARPPVRSSSMDDTSKGASHYVPVSQLKSATTLVVGAVVEMRHTKGRKWRGENRLQRSLPGGCIPRIRRVDNSVSHWTRVGKFMPLGGINRLLPWHKLTGIN